MAVVQPSQAFLPTVADTLLLQFKALAKLRLDAASPQDRGEAGGEPVYEKVLAGLHLVACQAATPLLDALLNWRKESLAQAARAGLEAMVLRKRLAVEKVFLETSSQLVGPGTSGLTDRQSDALERLAFDWILNAEKYVESKHTDLSRAREKVTSLAAEIIGALSRTRLAPISARFFKELEARLRVDASAARQEILQMCEGMRHVRLQVSNDVEVLAACDFLLHAHPLKHVAPVRKSQVQHALCEMLTSILAANVRADQPRSVASNLSPEVVRGWYDLTSQLRAELAAWTAKQSKHAAVAYPLLTLLVCLEEDVLFTSHVDPLVDTLHRQLKDKLLRTLILGCLLQCISTFTYRHATMPRDRMAKWLTRATKPVIANLRKGNFQFPEQQDLVRQMCVVVSHRIPEFGITNLVLELMQLEAANWDGAMIGLRSLLSVLLAAPLLPVDMRAAPPEEEERLAQRITQASAAAQLLDMLGSGQSPLTAYGVAHLTLRVSQTLGHLMATCHNLFAGYRQVHAARPLNELLPKEKQAGLPVFGMALCCVPYIVPEHWQGTRLADEVSAYTMHADGMVRRMAVEVLQRIVRGLPQLRSAVLLSMSSLAACIPDDQPEYVREALGLLVMLIGEWVRLLEADGGCASSEGGPTQAPCPVHLARLEGTGFSLLASNDVDVRRSALELLHAARTLNQALLAAGSRGTSPVPSPGATSADIEPTYMIDVIEEIGFDVAHRCYWDFGRWSDLWRIWRPISGTRHDKGDDDIDLEVLMMRSGGPDDSVRWARCLCELMKAASQLCSPSARAAATELAARLQGLTGLRDSRGPSPDSSSEVGRLDLTRTYWMMVCAAPASLAQGPAATREVARLIVSSIRAGSEAVQQAGILALGCCNSDVLAIVLEEVQPLVDDYSSYERMRYSALQGARSRQRRDELRILVGHIFRLAADSLQPGRLHASAAVRDKLLDFIFDSVKYLAAPPPDLFVELQQLRYCVCVVARVAADQLASSMPHIFTAQHRRACFDAMAAWCDDGSQTGSSTGSGRGRGDVLRAVAAVRARLKDADAARSAEADIMESVDVLEHAAHQGMAAMLQGPLFDADCRRPQGRPFVWIDLMLMGRGARPASGEAGSEGPSRQAIGRRALLHLLRSNLDVLDVCLDQCYSPNVDVSRAYFQVLAEVYTATNMVIKPHILLALVLCKIIDEMQDVRDDALHVLDVMSSRVWRDASKAPPRASDPGGLGDRGAARVAVVIGKSPDSYHQFQYQLSAKLAREHPELSELVCVEVLTRQLETAGRAQQPQILTCLAPWCEAICFAARWEGHWTEKLLASLYRVTWRHGDNVAHEIERLWSTLAANRRNIIPILDYVISQGLLEATAQEGESLLAYFRVAKRTSLYLARISPQHTIDHLVYEIAAQIQEEEGAGEAQQQGPPAQVAALEFHHARPPPSRQSSGQSIAELRPSERVKSFGTPSASTPSGRLAASARLAAGATRAVLSRPELAMCLLAEIAYEHDEDFRSHLPLLFHATLIVMDSAEPLVYRHAQQVLVNLLYSLSARHLEVHRAAGAMVREYAQVTSLIAYLQSMQGRRLWAYEDVTLAADALPSTAALTALVNAIVDSIFFESDLRERWAQQALKCMLECSSRHLACRSHQVYRALRPRPSNEACYALLHGLHKCLQHPSPTSLDVAVDVILTLQVMVESLAPGKLVLYPQLVLTCLTLLGLSYVHLFRLGLDLAAKVLQHADLTDVTFQQVVQASTPGGLEEGQQQQDRDKERAVQGGEDRWWLAANLLGRPDLICVQQLLVKGLFRPETELATIQVLTQIAHQLAHMQHPAVADDWALGLTICSLLGSAAAGSRQGQGMAALLGQPTAQLALSLTALLPWLARHFRHSPHQGLAAACLKAHAGACEAMALSELAGALRALTPETGSHLADLMTDLCGPLTRAFFPRFAKLVCQRLMEVLTRAQESYHETALLLLRCIFEVAGLRLGGAGRLAADAQLFFPVAALLETPASQQALEVLNAVMQYLEVHPAAADGQDDLGGLLHWENCIDDTGAEHQLALGALGRIVDSWSGQARKLGRSKLMPFVQSFPEDQSKVQS
ncbi:hypothetical protein WJX72_008722 [[Myrmecia] bisecta]|uniref:Huntingtin n=1 Tax=[Myrmecia] bisecta TaxID=41462 RepID=A0AAW1R845_9CHLO